ncbi:hypothetical protein H2204_001674 [Knufia peltigerae]|uniref:Uncharacterized protein n=1 Tax=Knufia peltigerae TaxID=1002370 RepID=A0AA38YCP3_9EURO|nr:hypothetical protein H2204_001674 [Knufia peltigerae]
MKLNLLNPIDHTRSSPVRPIVPTLSLSEPINLQVVLDEDEQLDLLGTKVNVHLYGVIELLRYETFTDSGGIVSFKARPVRSEDLLNVCRTMVLQTPQECTTIDLFSSSSSSSSPGLDASQLPSSIEVIGKDTSDSSSDSSPLMQLVVRYVLSVSDWKGRTVCQEVHMLGQSLSEREGFAEAKILRPRGGYKRGISQRSSTWKWAARLDPFRHFRPAAASRPRRELTVDVTGYDPIVLRHQENTVSTVVRWRLRLANYRQQDLKSPEPKVAMSARWSLRSSTEWEISGSEGNHVRIQDRGSLHGSSSSTSEEAVTEWRQGFEESLEAEHCTTLSLPVRQFLAPTFFLGSIQHTYTLHLKVCCRVKGEKLNIRANLEFELPIALIYVAPGYDSDDAPPAYS